VVVVGGGMGCIGLGDMKMWRVIGRRDNVVVVVVVVTRGGQVHPYR